MSTSKVAGVSLLVIIGVAAASYVAVLFIRQSRVFGEREANPLEYAVSQTAAYHQSKTACLHISLQATYALGGNPSGSQKGYFQSECLQALAIMKKDVQLCELVRAPLFNANGISRDTCIDAIMKQVPERKFGRVTEADLSHAAAVQIENLFFLLGYDIGQLVKDSGMDRNAYWSRVASSAPDPEVIRRLESYPLDKSMSYDELVNGKYEALKVLRK